MSDHVQVIQKELAPYRQRLLEHPIYTAMHDINDLKVFMEMHVFAVWDFMSLLKTLQHELTCVTVPWIPKGSPATRRLINEIVLDEETDVDEDGKTLSHFELYLKSMESAGANLSPIKNLWHNIAAGKTIHEALEEDNIPPCAKEFMEFTFKVIERGKVYEQAAVFIFGRTEIYPVMLQNLVHDLYEKFPEKMSTFAYYLDRLIQTEEEVIIPVAFQMISDLCGDDDDKWKESLEIAKKSIEVRLHFWDQIMHVMKTNLPANGNE